MQKEERLKIIVALIDQYGKVEVEGLARHFDVSRMTVRRDLRELEMDGLLKKVYGGAYSTANLPIHNVNDIYVRMKLLAQEKQNIAKKIAAMIQTGEMIFIGSGTTTTYLAKALSLRSDIVVVTNALTVVEELATNGSMTVITVGGFLRRNEYSFYGHFSERILRDLRVDKVIMGMRGIHPDYGLTSDFPQELQTDREIISTGSNVIIAGDRTKIGYIATTLVAPITKANIIVTSKGADENTIRKIQQTGPKVIIA
ncbi:MAG: DeoR/GlpR family DNA-binding transcription regulator [Anaerolineaceae bacterium]|nr:DeoR/GlpR family DNA-binding transcription regulator [Anaerolineaceae bacterium]